MTKDIGAIYRENRCSFAVWAPEKQSMLLHIVHPSEQFVEMQKHSDGYFSAELENIHPGDRYYFRPNGEKDFPDPASFSQPEGVLGASEVVEHSFAWTDNQWKGIPLEKFVIYEIHIGTFTADGTFDSAIELLDDLVDMGINAVEIMPVAQFPGERNWGYDGVFPYAPQNSYNGPGGLKRFVNACHARGIAVILDVVYNHIGPEGNCLWAYGPYFTDKYHTPWGKAINFDGEWCDGVRNYFCHNALYWIRNFHIDALRLDAIHEMYDFGALHFWEMLHDAVLKEGQATGRHYYLVAESNLNNPKIIKHPSVGGYGFHAQWHDDFHHALHAIVRKRRDSYYIDYRGIGSLAKSYTDGFVLAGEYSQYRKRHYGQPSMGIPGNRFIVFSQNHDQVGNQVDGARIATKVDFHVLKVIAGAQLLSPYIPLLFMGEDYGEDAPFYYFIDHQDEALIEAVRNGRKEEFKNDGWDAEPPDPKDKSTFDNSKIRWEKRTEGEHNLLRNWYRSLLALRSSHAALKYYSKDGLSVYIFGDECFGLHRKSADRRFQILAILNLGAEEIPITPLACFSSWTKMLDSGDYSKEARRLFPRELSGTQTIVPPYSVGVYANTIS